MSRILRRLVLCSLFLLTATPVFAQEVKDMEDRATDLLTMAPAAAPAKWESFAETDWLRRSSIEEGGGNVTMGQVRAGVSRKQDLSSRFELTTGMHYSARLIDAPASAHLPESLHAVALELGGEYRTSDKLALGARVSPGLAGDFKAITGDDVRVPVALHARYRPDQQWTLIGGVAYTGMNRSFPVLPILGALYVPTPQWAFGLGFPRTGIMYRPSRGTELYLAAEFSGGEYRLHDPSVGANLISYHEERLAAGAEISLSKRVKLGLSVGEAFGRKFRFFDGDRPDLHVARAPFARLGLKFYL
ncbi:DUF6268 family outer membrane beta-barrel protein [Geomesophilobacter sediminis]|uniref:DUF6268 domain-containing protein n=1 Tax=Geomesophilobacter sediminis TaxID=2798584 RepID=A0A8J7IZQ1_9BACT|nr:DUF6268 family outer membrane beta-barrel protein [Geomesophilobacter sediminis]MBJ6723598.1 hypothetical protein [Geomesophilobacter sediminis]